MRVLLLIASMIGLLASDAAFAQAQVQLANDKLIKATNFVQELRTRRGSIATEEAIRATKLGCDGLQELTRDQAFRQRVSDVAAAAEKHSETNAAIRHSLARFLGEFLSPEVLVLERAGLSSTAIVQVVKDGFDLQAHAYIGKYGGGSAEHFLRNLDEFTNEVCRAAGQAKLIAEGKKEDMLFRLGVGLGGAAVVLADLTLTPTWTGPLAVQSYSFGFTLLAGAILK
ncbi:hypothetical protein [Achromobacter animicus]|nr:hypothetical protein [Achromobacter animicus]